MGLKSQLGSPLEFDHFSLVASQIRQNPSYWAFNLDNNETVSPTRRMEYPKPTLRKLSLVDNIPKPNLQKPRKIGGSGWFPKKFHFSDHLLLSLCFVFLLANQDLLLCLCLESIMIGPVEQLKIWFLFCSIFNAVYLKISSSIILSSNPWIYFQYKKDF